MRLRFHPTHFVAAILAVVLASPPADARDARTITGRIDATGCGLDLAPTALDDDAAARTTRCLGEGKPAILREDATSEVYFATFADASAEDRTRWIATPGKRVRVTGTVSEHEGVRTLAVARLRVEHDHGAAPHGGVVGMVGEHHLELVTTPEGEIRVYLLDAFLDPIPATGVAGSAVVTDENRVPRDAAIRVADGAAFVRVDTAARKGDREITVKFTAGPIPPTSMNLPFPASGAAPDACPHHPGKH
jgi:hypothetical protein